MKNFLLFFITIIFLFSSCRQSHNGNFSTGYNSISIHNLILKAINGNESANNSLSNLIDQSNPDHDFSKLVIDSIQITPNKIYYSALLEFPNPIYNRFAVYDQKLKAYLLDKSLNGYLSEETLRLDDGKYFKVLENFNSVNNIKLQRLSLYKAGDFSVTLVFRDFTKMIDKQNEYYQKIKEFFPDRIITTLNSKKRSVLNNKGDVYSYNITSGKYVSTDSLFYKFVKNILDKNKSGKEKNILEKHKNETAGNTIEKNVSTENIKHEYTINLSQHWKEINNVSINYKLKKGLNGTKYINSSIRSEISIARINYKTSSTEYLKYDLKNFNKSNPNLRFSDIIKVGDDYLTFYEYKNNCKKYLIMIETTKDTYNNYKTMFNKIINSFSAEC